MGLFDKKTTDELVGDGEPKKSRFKTYLIIGIVICVAIVAFAISRRGQSEAAPSTYSLTDAQANITALETSYMALASQVAQATTNIASINSRISGASTDWGPTISSLQNTQQSLQQSISVLSGNVTSLAANIGDTAAGNGTFNFTALNNSVTTLIAQVGLLNTEVTQLGANQTANLDEFRDSFEALNATVSNLTAELHGLTFTTLNYAQVTDVQPGVDSNIAWITVHGSGSFPVIVTFYGSNLTDTETNVFSPSPSCILSGQYLYGDSILSAVIMPPVSGWPGNRVIMVTVTKGLIEYATAVIGGS